MRAILTLLLTTLVLTGCDDSDPCDPGFALEDQLCRPVTTQDAAVAPDAGNFGKPCTDNVNHSECIGGPAPLCFKLPTDARGYCSAVGCDADPTICPAGWTCLDLSKFQAGAPFGCVKF